MKARCTWFALCMAACLCSVTCRVGTSLADEANVKVSHDVYFVLADDSPKTETTLIAYCYKYLTDHRGLVVFSVGPRAKDMEGDLNDRDFDVALHLVFLNKAALNAYAKSERHQQFVEEAKSLWSKVRVCDSYAAPDPHHRLSADSGQPAMHSPAIPDPAKGFAGLIRGKVVHKMEHGVVLQVAEVVKAWEHNKAKDAHTLVYKVVVVRVRQGQENPAKFLAIVHEGEEVVLDVANQEGETMTLLELTDDQRERVKANDQ